MKITSFTCAALASLLAVSLLGVGCSSEPTKPGQHRTAKEAAKIFDVLDHNARGFLDQNPTLLYIAAKSYQSADQCTKAVAAYKRLLPMMRKGTKDYTNVQKSASATCHTTAKKSTH